MIKISPFGNYYAGKCYKQSFRTKKIAKKKMKMNRPGRKMKTAYQCRLCKQWHLSHLSVKEYARKVADYKLMKFLKGEFHYE